MNNLKTQKLREEIESWTSLIATAREEGDPEEHQRVVDHIMELFKSHSQEVIEGLRKELDILMNEKRAKELSDQLELYGNGRGCAMCGTDPKRQREMILEVVDDVLEKINI